MPHPKSLRRQPSLKLLHVLGGLNRGGIETFLVNALPYRDAERFRWSVCIYRHANGSYATEFARAGISVEHIPISNTVWGIVNFAYKFFRYLRRQRFDIVHCHGAHGLVMLLSWLAGVPARIAHAHSSAFWPARQSFVLNAWSRRLERWLARIFATRGIACSICAAEFLFGTHWRETKQTQLLYCGLDLSLFAACAPDRTVRAAFGINPKAKVLGHVANLRPVKNHRFLIEIFKNVSERLPDAVLCLVGDGPLRRSIESQVRGLNLQDRVVFTGVADDVPQKMMNLFDAFVMPSLYEGLPEALLEAQAAGLRCVISDQISKEAVVRPNTVTSVSLQDRAAWVESLVQALSLPRPSPGFAEMAGSAFDVKTSTELLEALYVEATQD